MNSLRYPEMMLGKLFIAALMSIVSLRFAYAQSDLRVEFEGGVAYQTRNTCAIPADSTKFSYRDLFGRGPFKYGRLTAFIHENENSGYRIAVVPLTASGVGKLPAGIKFSGVNFAPGVDTFGRYTFNNYRFTWWHRWRPIDDIQIRAGWTFFVRDADVALSQGTNHASFYNLGPVPLFYLDAEKKFGTCWDSRFEFDGLVAPQGGALDFGLSFGYKISDSVSLRTHFRYLDGGTGSGSAYNYATIYYLGLGLEAHW